MRKKKSRKALQQAGIIVASLSMACGVESIIAKAAATPNTMDNNNGIMGTYSHEARCQITVSKNIKKAAL